MFSLHSVFIHVNIIKIKAHFNNQKNPMKYTKKINFTFMIFLMFSFSVYANPNAVLNISPKYDKKNRMINPDEYFLRQALVAYKLEKNESAFSYFMKSAAFGNSDAQMYIGLMYIKSLGVSQSWAKGFAWLQLAAKDNTKKHVDLMQYIQTQLKPEELELSKIELININKEYEASVTYKRRDRWVRKQKLKTTGSRTGSKSMAGRLVSQDLRGVVIDGNAIKKVDQFEMFVDHFNFGYVTGGKIVPKEEK